MLAYCPAGFVVPCLLNLHLFPFGPFPFSVVPFSVVPFNAFPFRAFPFSVDPFGVAVRIFRLIRKIRVRVVTIIGVGSRICRIQDSCLDRSLECSQYGSLCVGHGGGQTYAV
jgi:hypothetical protein